MLMPIVMGMVAGVFLRFGLDLIRSLYDDAMIVAPMVEVWIALSFFQRMGRRLPPLIGALPVSALVVMLTGRFDTSSLGTLALVQSNVYAPVRSLGAMFGWDDIIFTHLTAKVPV
jgi:benzoate membrane transport protein